MPVVPVQQTTIETSAIRLARYSQIIMYDECRFWGIAVGTPTTTCRDIWTLPQRLKVAKYLAEAQIEFESILQFPVGKRWITEEQRSFHCPGMTEYGKVIEAGIQAVSTIATGAAVTHAADPATIGPIAVTFTDPWEVHVYHPGTNIEIDPSEVSIAGGNLNIKIPRCRMVKVALADNDKAGLQYSLVTNYDATVDIKRIYNDPSTQAVLVTNHKCLQACSSSGCSAYTYDGCIFVSLPEIGKVEVYPASYSGGVWTKNTILCCNNYRFVKLNYLAGQDPDYQIEDAIVRLAHSKMPVEPCGCDPAKSLWQRDRNVPTVLTAERLNCPFGLSDGAWFAWQQALNLRLVRGGGLL